MSIQVLEVVRASYDTLTLKLQDSLDQFERYAEKPKETGFFTQLVSFLIPSHKCKALFSKCLLFSFVNKPLKLLFDICPLNELKNSSTDCYCQFKGHELMPHYIL